jgi:hypothetical protein
MEKDSFAASITPLSATNESVAGITQANTRKTAYLTSFGRMFIRAISSSGAYWTA